MYAVPVTAVPHFGLALCCTGRRGPSSPSRLSGQSFAPEQPDIPRICPLTRYKPVSLGLYGRWSGYRRSLTWHQNSPPTDHGPGPAPGQRVRARSAPAHREHGPSPRAQPADNPARPAGDAGPRAVIRWPTDMAGPDAPRAAGPVSDVSNGSLGPRTLEIEPLILIFSSSESPRRTGRMLVPTGCPSAPSAASA